MATNNRNKGKQNTNTPQAKNQTAKANTAARGQTEATQTIDDSAFQNVENLEQNQNDESLNTGDSKNEDQGKLDSDDQSKEEKSTEVQTDASNSNPSTDGEEKKDDKEVVDKTVEEKKVDETSQPVATKPEAQQLSETPQPKSKGRFKQATVPTPVKAVTDIKNLSINEVVKHKHDYDLDKADGPVLEVIEFLNRYEEQMKPTINTDVLIGESLQRQLYKNYLKILGLDAVERGVCMEILLWKFFVDEKGSFRVSNLSRYTRNGKWVIEELQMYLQLNNLFNIAKDPSERIAKLRSIKLGPTVENFPTEKAKYTESLITWAGTLK